jgi:hypothetical protein
MGMRDERRMIMKKVARSYHCDSIVLLAVVLSRSAECLRGCL